MVKEVGGGHAPPSLADVKQLCESCRALVELEAFKINDLPTVANYIQLL
jgi:hypothetical protein